MNVWDYRFPINVFAQYIKNIFNTNINYYINKPLNIPISKVNILYDLNNDNIEYLTIYNLIRDTNIYHLNDYHYNVKIYYCFCKKINDIYFLMNVFNIRNIDVWTFQYELYQNEEVIFKCRNVDSSCFDCKAPLLYYISKNDIDEILNRISNIIEARIFMHKLIRYVE